MVSGLRYGTARELFEARPCIARDMTAAATDQASLDFCRFLLDGGTPEEAVTFCAYLLPARAAIWWAHECLGHLAEFLEEEDLRLLAAVADWVAAPDDASALANAAARTGTPAGRLAAAAATAGIADGARETACAVASGVNAAILTALAGVAISDRFPVLEAFVGMGTQLAEIEAVRQPAVAR